MPNKINLNLPFVRFEALFVIANGRAKNCVVARKDLINLLMDHSKLLGKLGDLVEYDYATSKRLRNTQ